jgi:WD40 repeat protein
MRLVRGSTLREAIRRFSNSGGLRTQSLEFRQLLNHLVRICDIVSYAHSRGVLHRDLKPSNILLGKYGETLVVDWGLAKPMGQPDGPAPDEMTFQPASGSGTHATVHGMQVGTPPFMSPEQAQGNTDQIGPPSDVYSLGAILYMILTGQPPLSEVESSDAVERVATGAIPPPRRLVPEIPRILDRICRKAMAVRPADRYASAQELGSDVEHWLADEPVVGVTEGFSHRLVRWERRYRTGIRVAGVALVVLAALASASAFVIDRARQEAVQQRSEAVQAKQEADQKRDDERRLSTRLLLDRGLGLLERKQARSGLLWMTRALEEASDPSGPIPPMERAIRANLAAWTPTIHRIEACLPHEGAVRVLAASPQGDLVATTGQDGTILVWDGRTGQRLGSPLKHGGRVRVLRFHPDGAVLASGSDDLMARLWTLPSGSAVGEPMAHSGPVVDLAFSGDGAELVTASSDGTARSWDGRTGAPRGEPLTHDALPLSHLALDESGRRLACVTESGRIRLWDRQTGQGRWVENAEMATPPPVAFTPSGRHLATANASGQAVLFDVATGILLDSGPRKHIGPVEGLVVTSDGNEIITCGYDTSCVRWKVPGLALPGAHLEQVRAMRQRGHLWALALSPDSALIATACDDNTVQIWDRAEGERVGDSLPHTMPVHAVAFLDGGRTVVTGCDDGYARVWRLGKESQVGAPMNHSTAVYGLAVRHDGRVFATTTFDGGVWLWETATGRLVAHHVGHAPDRRVLELEFTGPNSPHPLLVSGGEDGRVRFWNPETLEPEGPVLVLGKPPVRKIVVSPDGRLLAVGDNAGRIGLWDLVSFQSLLDFETQHIAPTAQHADRTTVDPAAVTALAFDPSGARLAVGTSQGAIQLWDVATRTPRGDSASHAGSIRMLQFSPDGITLASGSTDKSAQIWNARSLEPIGHRLSHDGAVWSVEFSPNSRLLATASFDGTVRLWNAAGALLGEPMRNDDMVYRAQFTSDGSRLVTYGRSRAVRVWDVATQMPVGPPLETGGEVLAAALLPGDQGIVAAGRDNRARVWTIGAPGQGEVNRVMDEIRRLTGLEFGPGGVIQAIPPERWLALGGRKNTEPSPAADEVRRTAQRSAALKESARVP